MIISALFSAWNGSGNNSNNAYQFLENLQRFQITDCCMSLIYVTSLNPLDNLTGGETNIL